MPSVPQKNPTPTPEDVLGEEDAYQAMGSAPAAEMVRRRATGPRRPAPPKIETVVAQGRPADTLHQVVTRHERADLLVVGNRGLDTLAGRIIGSVPLDVARHMLVDVLVVHTT